MRVRVFFLRWFLKVCEGATFAFLLRQVGQLSVIVLKYGKKTDEVECFCFSPLDCPMPASPKQ